MVTHSRNRFYLIGLMIVLGLGIGYFQPGWSAALGQGTIPLPDTPTPTPTGQPTFTPIATATATPTSTSSPTTTSNPTIPTSTPIPATPTPISVQATSTPAPISGPNVPCAINPWRFTTNMTTKHSYHGIVIYNDTIYAVGGWHQRVVESAPVNTDGTLGLWRRENSISTLHQDLALVAYDGYLYALGGHGGDSFVEYAKINDDGSLSQWQFTNPLTTGRSQLSGFATQGYIYAIGGDEQTPSTVERAKINVDGSLAAWELVNHMVYGHHSRHAFVIDNFVYVIGQGLQSENHNSIERAQINTVGALDSWQVIGSLPEARGDYTIAATSNAMYLIGGYLNNNVTRITINADGTFGQSSALSPLHFQRGGAMALTYHGNIYVVGGHDYASPNSEESVEWALLDDLDIPRNYGLSINDGSLFVNQTAVTLNISGNTSSIEMQVSNDGGFSGSIWEPCRAAKNWEVTSFGSSILPRTVYIRFRDSLGTVSNTFQDDIILDVNAPTGSVDVQPLVIRTARNASASAQVAMPQANNAVYLPLVSAGSTHCPATGTANAKLQLGAQDDISGVGEMMISNDSKFTCATWQPYKNSQNWYVPTGVTTTVYVKFQDNASNVSEVASDTVNLPVQ